jgi:diacylglycerol kinase (ATP)
VTARPCTVWPHLPEPGRSLRVLVANPLARGVNRAALGRIAERLGLDDRAIREAGRDGTTRALAAEAVRAGATCVIAAGGDGTVHEVVQELAGSRSALGVIPLGTSNDLAARAGIPNDLDAACALTTDGTRGALDVLSLDGWRIATVGGFGFPAQVARTCNALRSGRAGPAVRLLGHGIYTAVTIARILAGGARRAAVALRLDRNAPAVLPVSAILFGVAPRFGGGISLFPDGSLAPGTFAALIVTAGSRAGLLSTLLRTKAGRSAGPGARLLTGLTRLDLRTFRPLGTFGDGEWLGERRRASVTVEQGALQVMVPWTHDPATRPPAARREAR